MSRRIKITWSVRSYLLAEVAKFAASHYVSISDAVSMLASSALKMEIPPVNPLGDSSPFVLDESSKVKKCLSIRSDLWLSVSAFSQSRYLSKSAGLSLLVSYSLQHELFKPFLYRISIVPIL